MCDVVLMKQKTVSFKFTSDLKNASVKCQTSIDVMLSYISRNGKRQTIGLLVSDKLQAAKNKK